MWKICFNEGNGYQYYTINFGHEFYIDGKKDEDVFRQDIDGFIVSYDREKENFYNNVLGLFDVTEQVRKLNKKDVDNT